MSVGSDRASEAHPGAVAVGCLAVFLGAASVPGAAWLEAAGVGPAVANVAWAGVLALVAGGMLAAFGERGQLRGLGVVAGVAVACCALAWVPGAGAVREWGLHLAWCAFTGLAEETLFCGVLFPCLVRSLGARRAGMLACATLFAACHVGGGLPVGWLAARVVVAWPFSLGMLELFRRSGRLWVVAVCHGLVDAVVFGIVPGL